MCNQHSNPDIEALRRAAPSLCGSAQRFANSLLDYWDKKGYLSNRQWPYVKSLTKEAQGDDKAPAEFESLGDVNGLFELFQRARDNDIQRPKIKFECEGRLIRLAWHPNGIFINVKIGDNFQTTLGRINTNGNLIPYKEWEYSAPDSLVDEMKGLVADPSKFGRAQGQRLKWCIFCSRELTTTDSLFYGYGPICAEKYMLEWGQAADHLIESDVEKLKDF